MEARRNDLHLVQQKSVARMTLLAMERQQPLAPTISKRRGRISRWFRLNREHCCELSSSTLGTSSFYALPRMARGSHIQFAKKAWTICGCNRWTVGPAGKLR